MPLSSLMKAVLEIPDNIADRGVHKPIIIAARANELVVSRLIDGALRAFSMSSIKPEEITIMRVSGALEIPLALKKVALSRRHSAHVVLGAIIKGESDHYDHVSRIAYDGVFEVALKHELALGTGILCVHNLEQALSRSDGPHGNLGFDAAMAALKLSASFFNLEQDNKSR
jgi:6,7-dimethyl-8-ribityllumazine synthase